MVKIDLILNFLMYVCGIDKMVVLYNKIF